MTPCACIQWTSGRVRANIEQQVVGHVGRTPSFLFMKYDVHGVYNALGVSHIHGIDTLSMVMALTKQITLTSLQVETFGIAVVHICYATPWSQVCSVCFARLTREILV